MSALSGSPAQYALTPEQEDLRALIRELAEQRITPRAAAIDASGSLSRGHRETAG